MQSNNTLINFHISVADKIPCFWHLQNVNLPSPILRIIMSGDNNGHSVEFQKNFKAYIPHCMRILKYFFLHCYVNVMLPSLKLLWSGGSTPDVWVDRAWTDCFRISYGSRGRLRCNAASHCALSNTKIHDTYKLIKWQLWNR